MDREGSWNYTEVVKDVLVWQGEYEEVEGSGGDKAGFFQGRRLITRDSPINGGVYVCFYPDFRREAVVVDDTKQERLNDVYQELLKRRGKVKLQGRAFKAGILEDVYKLVGETLPYDSKKSEASVAKSVKIGRKVALEIFINDKVGVCRHQALLAAYLLERLKKEGRINPRSISVDRNFIDGKGGHAWVRYVNSAGEVFIIDPAKGFIGTLDSPKRPDWPYERPGERKNK